MDAPALGWNAPYDGGRGDAGEWQGGNGGRWVIRGRQYDARYMASRTHRKGRWTLNGGARADLNVVRYHQMHLLRNDPAQSAGSIH
jgi:N-methylhydantoinase B/oxoprolinase/acetone carboxylase alpha subunit